MHEVLFGIRGIRWIIICTNIIKWNRFRSVELNIDRPCTVVNDDRTYMCEIARLQHIIMIHQEMTVS